MNQPMTLEQVAEFIRAGEFRGNAYAEQAAATVEAAALDAGAAEVLAEWWEDKQEETGLCPGPDEWSCRQGPCRECVLDHARAEPKRRREAGA